MASYVGYLLAMCVSDIANGVIPIDQPECLVDRSGGRPTSEQWFLALAGFRGQCAQVVNNGTLYLATGKGGCTANTAPYGEVAAIQVIDGKVLWQSYLL
jgi:hypothetical protein